MQDVTSFTQHMSLAICFPAIYLNHLDNTNHKNGLKYEQKIMPSPRCVVQGCSNIAVPGISIHTSPTDRKERLKWVNFVRLHRANFFQTGEFSICSEHFLPECFHRAIPVPGTSRRLKKGSCPSIWIKSSEQSFTSRKRRKVFLTFVVFFCRFSYLQLLYWVPLNTFHCHF